MSGLPPKLAVVEFGVEALSGQQFLVDAPLDDAALFAYEHLVGVAYGAQAVCVNMEIGNQVFGLVSRPRKPQKQRLACSDRKKTWFLYKVG
jgi:hypothetical protein